MAVNISTIDKVNQINKEKNNKTIEANLLHVLNVNKDIYDNQAFLDFQFKTFHNGQFEKSKMFLRNLSKVEEAFSIEKYANRSLSIFKSTEDLLRTIEAEKIFLLNDNSKIANIDKKNKNIFEKIYDFNNSQDLESLDFFNGHFLLIKNLINLFSSKDQINNYNQLNSNNTINNDNTFKYTSRVLSLIDPSKDDKSEIFLNYLLNFKKEDIANWANSFFFTSINSFLKNYLGFQFDLNVDNNKIKNFKKYPLTTGIIGQSIFNLLEQEDFMSLNSLFYGILPVNSINKSKLFIENISNLPFFSNSKEILQLKYIDPSKINNDIVMKSLEHFSFKLNNNSTTRNKKSFIEKRRPNSIISSLSLSNFKGILNINPNENNSLYLSNSSLINNNFKITDRSLNLNKRNLLTGARNINDIDENTGDNVTLPIINDQFTPGDFSNLKKHSINIISLIASSLNNNNLHILQRKENGSYLKKGLIDTSLKGIHNYNFFETESLQSSILKNRLLCNFIVKEVKNQMLKNNNHVRFKDIFLNNINSGYSTISYKMQQEDLESNEGKFKDIEEYVFKEDNLGFQQNRIYVDDPALTGLNNISFKKNFILQGSELNSNQNLIEKNLDISGIENKHKEFINIDNLLQEEEIKNSFREENKQKIESIGDKLYDIDNLKHFTTTSSFFEKIAQYCKEYIEKNTDENDHKTNFAKRANISETATLLWLFNEKNLEKNKEVTNSIIESMIGKSTSRNSQTEVIKTKRYNEIFNKIKNSSEIVSSVTPFYLFGNNLNDDYSISGVDFSNNINSGSLASLYNPNSNKDLDDGGYLVNINPNATGSINFEQNGLFYNFLFSNYHQEKLYSFRTNDNITTIEEYENCNNLNFNKIDNHFFSFNENIVNNGIETVDDLLKKMSIKNIFNSGFDDHRGFIEETSNAYTPNIYLDTYQRKASFFITHECKNPNELEKLKRIYKEYLAKFKEYSALYRSSDNNYESRELIYYKTHPVFDRNIFTEARRQILEQNIEKFIQQRYILNIATPLQSFFEVHNDNFFDRFFEDIFARIIRFDLDNDTDTLRLRHILKSALSICSDVFCKMYIDLQHYTNLCNRLYESGFFSKGFKKFLTVENAKLNTALSTRNLSEIDRLDPFVDTNFAKMNYDNLENLNCFYAFEKSFNKNNLNLIEKIKNTIQVDFYSNDNDPNIDNTLSYRNTQYFFNQENFKSTNNVILLSKPSFKKLYHCLGMLLGLNSTDISRIFLYIFANHDLLSKNNFIFDIFNLHSIKNKNVFFLDDFRVVYIDRDGLGSNGNIISNIDSLNEKRKSSIFDNPPNLAYINFEKRDIITFINDSNLMFFDYLYENSLQKDQNHYVSNLENRIKGNIFSRNSQSINFLEYGKTGQINNKIKDELINSYVYENITNFSFIKLANVQLNSFYQANPLLINYLDLVEIFSLTYGFNKNSQIEKLIMSNDISQTINQKDLLNSVVFSSFVKKENYSLTEMNNRQDIYAYSVKSGCDNIASYDNNFLIISNGENSEIEQEQKGLLWIKEGTGIINFRNYIDKFNASGVVTNNININDISLNINDISFNNSISSNITRNTYVNINQNWFNHIIRGLIINDLSHSLNLDIVKYFNSYEDGIGKDAYVQYKRKIDERNTRINAFLSVDNSFLENRSSIEAKDYLKQKTGLKNFYLNNDNLELKQAYISQFLNSKKLRDFNGEYNGKNKDIQILIKNDFFINHFLSKCTFKDFYIEKNLNSDISNNVNNPLKENYIKDSTILTIGIENNVEIKRDDILLVSVEMIDHDYPWIIWENKVFEFDCSIDNPHDFILGDFNPQTISNIDVNQNLQNLKFPLIDYSLNENEVLNPNRHLYLRNMVSGSQSNNILSLINDNNSKLFFDINSDIESIIEKRSRILYENLKNKLNISGLEDVSEQIKTFYIKNIVKRAIHHQLMSYKLEKILKFTVGFEPKKNISLQEDNEKFLNKFYVLDEIYDLYVNKIFDIVNKENMNFTYNELLNSFSATNQNDLDFEYVQEYKGYNFKIATLTTNYNLNIFLKFMHDISKMLLPDLKAYCSSNFSKVLNVLINKDDFVISKINYQNSSIPGTPVTSNLRFEKINISGLDISSNPEVLNNLSSFNSTNKTFTNNYVSLNYEIFKQQDLNIEYYIAKKGNSIYKPKNVSYRIKINLMEN